MQTEPVRKTIIMPASLWALIEGLRRDYPGEVPPASAVVRDLIIEAMTARGMKVKP